MWGTLFLLFASERSIARTTGDRGVPYRSLCTLSIIPDSILLSAESINRLGILLSPTNRLCMAIVGQIAKTFALATNLPQKQEGPRDLTLWSLLRYIGSGGWI